MGAEQLRNYGPQVSFYDVAVHGNSAWFCGVFYNALFHVDMTTFEIELESFLPCCDHSQWYQYSAIEYYDGKLVIGPNSACDILIYDLETREITRIELDRGPIPDNHAYHLFFNMYIHRSAAFLFGGRYQSIVKLDLNSYKVSYIGNWDKMLNISDTTDIIFSDFNVTTSGICILPCWQNNFVVAFDLNTESYRIFELDNGNIPLSGCAYIDGDYWFSERETATLLKYTHSNEIEKIPVHIPGMDFRRGFFSLYAYDHKLYGIPILGNMIVEIDTETGAQRCIKELPADYVKGIYTGLGEASVRCTKQVRDDEVLIYSVFNGKILKLHLSNGCCEEHDSRITSKQSIIQRRDLLDTFFQNINLETPLIDIQILLDYLNQKILTTHNKGVLNGEKIYHTIVHKMGPDN